MRTLTNKAIAKIFREFADKIENGTCGTDAETLTHIANNMIHIKMTSEEVCSHLNCSRSTLSRMIVYGKVPHPYKDKGGNKYWYQDELDNHIAEYTEKYG